MTNLDSKSYKNLPPKKALERQEKEKKKKYCKSCENQHRHFTPFVVSMDGMYGFEARAFLKRLAKLLAEKWKKPYPTLRGLHDHITSTQPFSTLNLSSYVLR